MMMKNKFEFIFFLLFLTSISISSIILQQKNRRYILKKDKPISTYQFFITTQKRSKKLLALKWISIVGVVGLTIALILKKINKNQEDYLNHKERLSKKNDLETQAFHQTLESGGRDNIELEMKLKREVLLASHKAELLLRHQMEILDLSRQEDRERLLLSQQRASQESIETLESVGRDNIELEMKLKREVLIASHKAELLLRHQMEILDLSRQEDSVRFSSAQNKLLQELIANSESAGRDIVKLEMELQMQQEKALLSELAARNQLEMFNYARQQDSVRLSVAQNKLSQEFVLTSEEAGRNKVELEEELIQNIIITNKEQSRLIKQLISQTLTTSKKQDELINKFNKTQKDLVEFYYEFSSVRRSVKEGSGPSIIFNLLRNHVSESNFREGEQSESQNCIKPAEPHFATKYPQNGY